jgi:hypothetical protein
MGPPGAIDRDNGTHAHADMHQDDTDHTLLPTSTSWWNVAQVDQRGGGGQVQPTQEPHMQWQARASPEASQNWSGPTRSI